MIYKNSYNKFSRNRVNFKKFDKKTVNKEPVDSNNLAWRNAYLRQFWGSGLRNNPHYPWVSCGSNTYILNHQLLAWKCNRCGKYKQEDRKVTLDWLRKMNFDIDDEEYKEALKYKVPER